MYYTKYDLSFQTIHNVPISVEIQVDGYTGSPIVRKLGAPPVLKTQKNGRIISTSIELQAQCEVFGEFSEFYTSDPRHFLVIRAEGYLSYCCGLEPEVIIGESVVLSQIDRNRLLCLFCNNALCRRPAEVSFFRPGVYRYAVVFTRRDV